LAAALGLFGFFHKEPIMKYSPPLLLSLGIFAVLPLFAAGCSQSKSQDAQDANSAPIDGVAADTWMVNTDMDTAIQDGIITQHTLYPYDFVADSGDLNPLGLRDLGVLVDHFKATSSGMICVRQGDASDSLYQLRVNAVAKALSDAGLTQDQIVITDQMPGGQGMPSDNVEKILEQPSPTYLQSYQGAGASSSGASSSPGSSSPTGGGVP
jgi:hypothetical protein